MPIRTRIIASMLIAGLAAAACSTTTSSPLATTAPSVAATVAPSLEASPSAIASMEPSVGPSASASVAPSASATGDTFTITTDDAQFQGVQAEYPSGSALTLTNTGTRAHQMVVIRRNETAPETQTFEGIAALQPADLLGFVTVVGFLSADPGQAAQGAVVLDQPGDYAVVDLLPLGTMTAPPTFDPANLPEGLLNVTRGMVATFKVTGAGASPASSGSPEAPSISPAPSAS